MGLFGRRRRAGGTTLFFATDLHGSEVCFRKFVAAAAFYGADLLVLGGDLTGKFVVPVVSQGNGTFSAERFGEQQSLAERDVERFEADCANQGLYSQRMTAEEYRGFEADPAAADGLFATLMRERLERWLAHAREKLGDTDVRVLTAPGNDDPFEIDDVIRERGGDRVLLLEGELYEVAPGHEMLNTGWSNETPWHTHRETTEEELAARIERMAERLERPEAAIFNIHVPPYDSGLDTAPQLDESLTAVTSMGAPIMAPAGSTAVREAIERHQPLASLHGHIHEAGGIARIGRTVAMNAGSEYGEGVLRGLLVTVGDGELIRYQQTTG
jgi:Icc-related predicted phosphoesterase